MSKRAADQMALSDQSPYLAVTCACGKKVGSYLKHYEIVRCSKCGRFHRALQPKRRGSLVLFPWPGLPQRLVYQPIT